MTRAAQETHGERILAELQIYRGSVVSRAQLLAAMYRDRPIPLGAVECLRVQVTRLRAQLYAPWRIVSIRGVGYRLTDKPPADLSPIQPRGSAMRAIMFAVLLLLPALGHAQWYADSINSPNSPRALSVSSSAGGAGGSVTMRDRLQASGLGSYAAASGPCVGASTMAGLTFPGIGAQGGRTEIEPECQVREAARLLAAMGDTEGALRLIRSLPSVRAVLAEPPAVVATAPIATPPAAAALVAPAPARPAWCDTASPADGPRVQAACAR